LQDGIKHRTEWNRTGERGVTKLQINTEPSLITNYTTLLQVTVALCSGA